MDNFNCGQLSALAGITLQSPFCGPEMLPPFTGRGEKPVVVWEAQGTSLGKALSSGCEAGSCFCPRKPGSLPPSQSLPPGPLAPCFLIISDSCTTTWGSESPSCEGRENKQVTSPARRWYRSRLSPDRWPTRGISKAQSGSTASESNKDPQIVFYNMRVHRRHPRVSRDLI